MIHEEELAVCRRRGHEAGAVFAEWWVRCKPCGTWLRKVNTLQQRDETPPQSELESESEEDRSIRPVDAVEAAVCKRRGSHEAWTTRRGWHQCEFCGTWLRNVSTIEERAEDPPLNDQCPLDRLP
ncbi:MAG TPA: hypothetical protein VM120_15635 [Bryobacteraceae bacterium]|nr:hypothetical protein [Bryobacteraceae bacterium]